MIQKIPHGVTLAAQDKASFRHKKIHSFRTKNGDIDVYTSKDY
jgi:hypothetical protein